MSLAVPRPGLRGLRPGGRVRPGRHGAPRGPGPGPGQVGPGAAGPGQRGELRVWREQLPAVVLQRQTALCAGALAPAPSLRSRLGDILGDGLLRGL